MAPLCLGYDQVSNIQLKFIKFTNFMLFIIFIYQIKIFYFLKILFPPGSQISNSRKSFIFSKFIDDDDGSEYSKRKLDLDTIILKLKLKIYNNIYEFIDDLMKMLRYSVESKDK